MLFVETMGPTASMELRICWVSCCRDIVLIQDHSMFHVKLKMSPTNKCCKSCISCYMECGLPVDKNSCFRLRPYRSRICDAVGYVIRMTCWFAKILKVCGRNKNAWYVHFIWPANMNASCMGRFLRIFPLICQLFTWSSLLRLCRGDVFVCHLIVDSSS